MKHEISPSVKINSMSTQESDSEAPYIVVFKDEDKVYSKAIWALLSAKNVQIKEAQDLNQLKSLATNAILIIVPLQTNEDSQPHLPDIKQENPRIVCDILAFLPEQTASEDRMAVLAEGYDGVFNQNFIDYPVFKKLITQRLDKGMISLRNRRQQEEYKRFKSALSASPDAFIVLDEDNKLFFVSEHYKKAYPKNRDKLVRGLDINAAYDILSAEQEVFPGDPRYNAMKQFWLDPKGSIEFSTSNGRTWRLTAQPLSDGQGTIVTTTDITSYLQQKKQLEIQAEALSEALEKEQEASAVQKQFVNMVSHEFRTPLSIIDGHAQILQRRAEKLSPTDVHERAGIVRSGVSRLIGMMEGILSSNMLQSGKMNLVPQDIDVRDILNELCNEHVNLSGKVNIERDYYSVPSKLNLDPKIITLSVGNVISNAVKFSAKETHVKVAAEFEDDTLTITVSDQGIGIPENELKQIFKRFFRSTVSSGIPGTGIGLNLSKSLVELHGGTIEVESELGKGTRFTLTFKIASSL